MREVDTLIHAAWIAPVEPPGTLLAGHSVAVRDGRIEALVPTAQAKAAFSATPGIAQRLGQRQLESGAAGALPHAQRLPPGHHLGINPLFNCFFCITL